MWNLNDTLQQWVIAYNVLGTLNGGGGGGGGRWEERGGGGACKSYKNHYWHLTIITTHRYQLYPISTLHDDVIKWKNFQRYWPFVRRIHRSPVNSPHKGQRHGALKFSLICTRKKRLSKQSRRRWFETPSHSLWHHCNDLWYFGCWAPKY